MKKIVPEDTKVVRTETNSKGLIFEQMTFLNPKLPK